MDVNSLVGRKFYSRPNEPESYVNVLRVCRASNGYQVLFKYGEDGHAVFCGYRKFLKLYKYEVM